MRLRLSALAAASLCLFLQTPAIAGGDLPVEFDESRSGGPIDLSGRRLSFNEDFKGYLSLRGPRLFAPVHAPAGAGVFDPPEGPAYATVEVDGVKALRILAYKQDGQWRSGNVQTASIAQAHEGAPFSRYGFACKGCYFEARMKFPRAAAGYWSAFWLLSPHAKSGHVEVDVIEWYGGDPKGHHQSVHAGPSGKSGRRYKSNYISMLSTLGDGGWHDYGVQQNPGELIFYVDRREISRVKVPADFDVPLYPLVSLVVLPSEADQAKSPMTLYVDYIRAYAPPRR
jgi:hypothetical protein